MKNAQGFPDPGVKGEPGILGAIHRRQSINPGNASVVHLPTGTSVSIPQRKQAPGGAKPGPWESSISGNATDGYFVRVVEGTARSFSSETLWSVTYPDEDAPDSRRMPAVAGDVVYLRFNALYGGSLEVRVGSVGDDTDWEVYPQRAKLDGVWPYSQYEGYLELARVEQSDPEDENSPLVIVGAWRSGNVVAQQGFIYGKLAYLLAAGN
jgi:hypothetical protein